MNTGEPLTKIGVQADFEKRQGMGNLIVITGPSGVGKGTLVDLLLEQVPGLLRSVSVTTRKPRPGEEEGSAYFFRDRPEFERMINCSEFMEWAEFAGNLYGTPRNWVMEKRVQGFDVILEIEVKGARQISAQEPSAVLIFISPPSFTELEERLRSRATETADKIKLRLTKAKQELQEKNVFQYEVVNDKREEAAANLAHIVYAERLRLKTNEG